MSDFAPIAASLRVAVTNYFSGESPPEGNAITIATNSDLVERRAAIVVRMLAGAGVDELSGLEVLDLGCGFGALSAYLAAQGATVTGLDPHADRMEVGRAVAAEHGLAVTLLNGRMEMPGMADRSFDVAIQNNSLCYLVDRNTRAAALSETLRLLRPGGVLAIRNPNRWTPIDQFTGLPVIHLLPPAAAVRAAGALGRDRSFCRVTSPPATRRELQAAGFASIAQGIYFGNGNRPEALKLVARYQHFTARRPEEAP
jgi:SAM-dependent methyltransferase